MQSGPRKEAARSGSPWRYRQPVLLWGHGFLPVLMGKNVVLWMLACLEYVVHIAASVFFGILDQFLSQDPIQKIGLEGF